jgi:hypothetical protein
MEIHSTPARGVKAGLHDGLHDGLQIQYEAKCLFVSNDHDTAICTIWKSIGFNSKKFTNPYNFNDIERIVASYYDLQLENRTLPELDIAKLSGGSQAERNAQTLLINTVQQRAGAEAGLVRTVLEQLYYGTRDGRIKSARMLQPRLYDARYGNPKNESLTGTIEGYMKTGAIVVIGVGVCVGIYYAARAYNQISSAKQT